MAAEEVLCGLSLRLRPGRRERPTRSQAASLGSCPVCGRSGDRGSGGVCAVGICASCRSPSLAVPERTPARAPQHQHVWVCYGPCWARPVPRLPYLQQLQPRPHEEAPAERCQGSQGGAGGGGGGDSKDPAIWGMDRREGGSCCHWPHLGRGWAQADWVRSILPWEWQRGHAEGGGRACSHFSMTSARKDGRGQVLGWRYCD